VALPTFPFTEKFYSFIFSLFNRISRVLKEAMAGESKTARLAVTAAALALGGLVLAACARWSATQVLDSTQASVVAAAQRLGASVTSAINGSRARAQIIAAHSAVRAAVETDPLTVRDMARAGDVVLAPAPHEVIELVQLLPRRRPQSLLRAPENARSLTITRANEVRIDEEGGVLVVTVAAPVAPLSGRGAARGAVVVATRIDLVPLGGPLAKSGIAAELAGFGEPVALTVQRPGDGTHLLLVPVPFGDVGAHGTPPHLVLRAGVHASGGVVLWAGRVLLLAAFIAALLTFATSRKQTMPALDDAPTARRSTQSWMQVRAERERVEREEAELNAPRVPMLGESTAKEKRTAMHLDEWPASTPTPITRLEPTHESSPIPIDPRGDRLAGRYRLLQLIGRSHAAHVYLAQALVAGTPGTVALKLLGGPDSEARRAYLESARRLMRVPHINIAQVLDVGDGEVAYIAMEYVEGCTLEVLLRDLTARDEPLPLPQAVAIMAALCRGLDAARPVVHGAVKPSNVLVGRHNAVKLADFGAPPSAANRLAPEQYAGRRADRRSDVYAAGLVLHELVTGHRAAGAVGDSGRWPALTAPSSLRRGLPAELDAVVAKATRFGPRGRYSTAGDLLTAVAHATHDAVAGAATGWLGDWVDRARRSS
jgi:hypothetical protein